MLIKDFDISYAERLNIKYLCGTDEAGRGPLAGPVVAAACVFPKDALTNGIDGLDDSKKLTEKKRDILFDRIKDACISWAVGTASPVEIDEINILNASLLAMKRAIEKLSVKPEFILADGNRVGDFPCPAEAVVKGDAKSMSVAAASVIAKVTRDRLCAALDALYPQYGFAKHKGYPTKEHKAAVFKYGPCPEHRESFLGFLEREAEKLAEYAAK